jgi:glycosyltransferase involved in cell wall biosynthesis
LHRALRPLFNLCYTDGVACSESAGEWLFGKKKFIVLQNALDLEKYHFDTKKRLQMRENLHLQNKVAVAHVATLYEPKNHQFLLQVWKNIVANDKQEASKVLFLIGNGPLEQRLKSLADELEISDSVRFMGTRSDIPDLLQSMDALVLPSLYEGLPLVVLEGQANGLLCLISDAVSAKSKETALVQFLPLDESAWVKEMSKVEVSENRDATSKQAIESLCKAGYDIGQESKFLKKIYLEGATNAKH